MKKLLQEFKTFISRGNVLDMAVGVVIASSFTAIVNAAVSGLVTPIIGLFIPDTTSFAEWAPGGFGVGAFINAVISFIVTAVVIFLVMKVVNAARDTRKKPEEPAAPTTKTCPYCLSDDVKLGAVKCPHCGSDLPEEE
ncbi:MAG: large conductance mechanosensitive channel protein MscL [Clostridia bacterium]|nr:large conductance mechanosensitive channel protein MscL [Clostridia bacterium]